MSKTSVTTFQKAKTGSLVFPYVSAFGIIENPDLVVYLGAMRDAGHTLTLAQKNVLVSFMEDIEDFQSKIIEIYPIFGDENACALIPLFAKLTDNAILEGDIGYEEDGGKTVAIKPVTTGNKIALTPLTLQKLYNKDSSFAYPNSMSCGVLLYRNHDIATTNAFGIHAQADDLAGGSIDYDNYTRVVSSPYTSVRHRPFRSNSLDVSIGLSKFWHLCNYLTASKIHYGNLSSITEILNTHTAQLYDTDRPYHPELLKFGINGQANYDDSGALISASWYNTSSQTRFYSMDDGTMTTTEMNAYRTAIAALISGLDKDF